MKEDAELEERYCALFFIALLSENKDVQNENEEKLEAC